MSVQLIQMGIAATATTAINAVNCKIRIGYKISSQVKATNPTRLATSINKAKACHLVISLIHA